MGNSRSIAGIPGFVTDPVSVSGAFLLGGSTMPMDDLDTDFFLMANLRPATTGLLMVVWVSERGNARHEVRVEVALRHGDRIDPTHTAVFGVRPTPSLISGYLSASDQHAVSDWIALNEAAIVEYWGGVIDTSELLGRLKRI